MASAVLVKEVSPNNMNLQCNDVDGDSIENAGETSVDRHLVEREAANDDDGETTDDPPSSERNQSSTDENQRETPLSQNEQAAIAAALSWNPLEEVDSALLSALCDARERKGLLRLERVLVEFMRDPGAAHVEVGGAYNSIVLGSGEGVDRPVVSPQTMQEIQFQQQRGLRQTSFQRLILHRLADRFRIIREVIPSSHENLITTLNLIRLVKTVESVMPQHLLIDVDLSLLVDYRNPLARDSRGSAATMPPNNHDDSVKLLSDSMGSATLQENAPPAQTSNKKSKKKMVIMKRNSAGGSGAEDKAKSKREGKSGLKGKKLVDKEKAYEEARARIFGVCETAATTATADGSNNNDGAGEVMPQLNPQSPEFAPQNTSSLGDSNHSMPSEASETPGTIEGTGKSPDPNEETSTIISSDAPKEAVSAETQGSTATSTSTSPTPSALAATTKAVYRNRQQEENDPDFKRRSDIRPAYMTMPMVNGVPYITSNPYAPNNPYVNMVNMAMGQQHPMSVMPGQQQPSHLGYYGHIHGQPPNPQAYNIYPNHNSMAPPQSPAYYVTSPPGKNYPTAVHPNAVPPTNVAGGAIPSNTVHTAPSVGKNANSDASLKKSSLSKSKREDSSSLSSSSASPPNNEIASKPPQDGPRIETCTDSQRSDAVPTFYTAEDFPALQ
ncbi:hypothetical protein HJC23_003703 [Cyclotella cryptica]|uniref:SUZ domain-containing protein n=1 Tax=Cyclotella cryptica TaxID=29204 RepID=A0ABD3QTD3_9STRA|eukprot:CCRYP_002095-RA/>CCRYP_002095-RA protein AED:0.00 eAED:0.00 QI:171/-1/1/1/-1/1/1/138/668